MKTVSWLDKNGKPIILSFATINFSCPICKKEYVDSEDKYLNRCNKNKSGCTKIKCSCGKSFFMTYDQRGDAVSFLQ